MATFSLCSQISIFKFTLFTKKKITKHNGRYRLKKSKDNLEKVEGGEALEQVAQRSCGSHLPGNVQGQVGWSSEQPGLVEDDPAHGRGVGTR